MTGKFVKVKCNKCKNEQVIFDKASTEVKCLVCDSLLARPTGGRVEVTGGVIIAEMD